MKGNKMRSSIARIKNLRNIETIFLRNIVEEKFLNDYCDIRFDLREEEAFYGRAGPFSESGRL